MDAGMIRIAGALSLVVLAATPTPAPTPPPFELHRTAAAAHLAIAKANPLFVLVIGSDVREGDPAAGRADSLHILAVNQATKHGTLVGIPRDAWVDVPGRGVTKINEALHVGGPGKVVETVSKISGIPFHYWAVVDFSRFRQLVDRLGGVDVDIPYKMADADSGAFFEPGRRHLNGAEALAFARDRHNAPGGDLGRSENQGRLLLAALAKFRTDATEPLGVLRYLEAFRDLVVTDVPVRDLLTLGVAGRHLDPAGFQNVVVPARTGQVGAQSVVFLDPGAAAMFAAVRDDATL
jgi:LCP family protein required for cell wall assembly